VNSEEWRNRKMETRVLTYCEHCQTLQEKVEKRDWQNYSWGSAKREVHMTSCESCFNKKVLEEKMKPSATDYDSFSF
jgi:hypothetical protein